MPVEAARWFAERVSRSLIEVTPPSLGTRRAYMIDGTTITLAPEPELRKWFPPASNLHGVGAFPVALLVVAHELASGAALVPEIGAMSGPQAVYETSLIDQVLAQLPPDSVVMADAGFGIFTVAYAAHQAGHKDVLRLTPVRFKAMQRQATRVSEDDLVKTWSLTWRPTAPVRCSHPDLPTTAQLEVHLHAIYIHETLTLYLVSDLRDSGEALADLYEHRTNVEIDIRNMKVVLGTEKIRAKSRDMFLKEFLTSQVTYHQVIQFRRQAAALENCPPAA